MEYRVEVSREAEADALGAFVWIGDQSFEAATRWYGGLTDALNSLQAFPRRCSVVPDNDYYGEEVRQLIYGKRANAYRILFTIRGDTVYVLHVRHGSRDTVRPRKYDE